MEKKSQQSDFATVLFSRVDEYLKPLAVRQKGELALIIKALFVLTLYAWAYYQWLTTFDSFLVMMGYASLIGTCHVLVTISISHDGIHGAFSRNRGLNYLAAQAMNLGGASAYMFTRMHLRAHEEKENGSKHKSIETQKLLMKKANQKNVPVILYLFYGLYMVFVRDFELFFKERNSISKKRWALMIATKTIYFFAIWVIPLWMIPLPAWQILIGIFSIYLVVTLLAILILLMPTDPIEVSKEDEGNSLNDRWVREVLRNNVDFTPESSVLSFVCGGANMNVIHYLFPGISHVHYVAISRIVQETAEEYGLTYRTESIWKVFGIHARYMLSLNRT